MSSKKHPFLITFFALCLILSAAVFSAWQYRIELALKAVDHFSKAYDFEELNLDIQTLDMDGITLKNIRLGEEIRIGSLMAGFSLSGLLAGQVESLSIKESKVDISQPHSGSLGKLQSFFSTNETQEKAPLPVLPAIEIKKLHILRETEGQFLELQIDGNLAPNGSGLFKAQTKARHQNFTVESSDLELRFSDQMQEITLNFNALSLKDQQKTKFFNPLLLGGTVSKTGDSLDVNLKGEMESEQFNFTLSGLINIAEQSANLLLNVPELTFAKNSLQPETLFPIAKLPYPLSAKIGLRADIIVKDQVPTLVAKINTQNMQTHGVNPLVSEIKIGGVVELDLDPLSPKASFKTDGLKLFHDTKENLFNPFSLSITGQLKDNQVRTDIKVKLDKPQKTQVLNIELSHNLTSGSGTATMRSTDLDFSNKSLKLHDFSPLLSIINDANGEIKANVDMAWGDGPLKARASSSFQDLSLTSGTFHLEKINGALNFQSLLPLLTDKPQTLSIEKVTSAVNFDKPEMTFSLKGDKALINRYSSGFLGGTIGFKDFEINPQSDTHTIKIDLNNLGLERLFSLAQIDGLGGTGSLSGSLPITILKNDVALKEGHLKSDAPGILTFKSDAARQALAGGGQQVELLLDVLTNFHYESLELKINREPFHSALFNLAIKGKNPDVMAGRPFNLNINLEGNIDPLLKTLLKGYRLSEDAIRASVGR